MYIYIYICTYIYIYTYVCNYHIIILHISVACSFSLCCVEKAEADAKATYAALVQAKNKEFNTLQASIEEIPSTYTAL